MPLRYRFVADLTPIEQTPLPCEPTTSARLPGKGCTDRRAVHVRLITDDGTIAFGGSQLLRSGDQAFNPEVAGAGRIVLEDTLRVKRALQR